MIRILVWNFSISMWSDFRRASCVNEWRIKNPIFSLVRSVSHSIDLVWFCLVSHCLHSLCSNDQWKISINYRTSLSSWFSWTVIQFQCRQWNCFSDRHRESINRNETKCTILIPFINKNLVEFIHEILFDRRKSNIFKDHLFSLGFFLNDETSTRLLIFIDD